MSAYVELSNLTKIYPTPKGPAVIVKDFTLNIKKGEFVSLIGHSGCGKSTVLSMLAGLNEISGGGIILAGRELSGAGPDRGVVFQSPSLLPWLTAYENVMLGVNQVFYTASREERREIAEYYLTVVGLGHSMDKKPAELSQGMRQRVGIARAFALKPKMLLLDEPFGMLDSLTRHELQQVLIELWRRNKITALMVTHDVDEALFLSDRVVCMTNGPEAEVGDILEVPFERPRDQKAVMEHRDYYKYREHLITFLEERAHQRKHADSRPPQALSGPIAATETIIPENAPFNAQQRLWLNGFLAGYFARMAVSRVAPVPAGPAKPAVPLAVLFGSQTGTAESLAKKLAKDAENRGFAPRILALNDFEQANLATCERAVIISSTWGDGEPPDNAVNFWNRLKDAGAPRLEKLHYAILGLGDRNYSDFCGASKKFEVRLSELGAKALIPRGECDVDYEAEATAWMESLWRSLKAEDAAVALNATPAAITAAPAVNRRAASASNDFGKSNPFPARLLRNVCLNKPGSSKEIHHYEVSLDGSGLSYEAGDALGVMPMNCPELVDEIIGALKATPEETVNVGETILSLQEALTRHLDITKPSQELFATIANAAPAADLSALLALEKREEMRKWLYGRGIIDLLHLLAEPMPAADFVKLLKKLAPRLYSISSSPKAHPGEVHLTVSSVRYQAHGRGRKGVASTFLADRVGEADFVKVFVQPAHGFKPPSDFEAPMIMVGPGTGIAPFRAFLEERRATGARGRNWLFFGDQKRETDFLYEQELTGWQKDGHLTRLDLAFSRDQAEKIYVQNRMIENSRELYSWLEEGGHFYVCGDASRMAKDVDAALHEVIEKAGGRSADNAKAYVARMQSEKRYQRDVY